LVKHPTDNIGVVGINYLLISSWRIRQMTYLPGNLGSGGAYRYGSIIISR
jgi:hypothetical protein